jgi:hypothetical protein
MTLSGNNRRTRGQQLKQNRLDNQDRVAKRFPWLMPAIVTVAIVLVVAGIIVAAVLGHLF